jgi:hypothetical protein
MPTTTGFRPEFEANDGLLRLLGSTERAQLDEMLRDRIELATLRRQTESDLAELKAAITWLAEHSEQPVLTDADSEWIIAAAKKAQEKEQQAVAHFPPVITLLKSALATPANSFEADVQQLLRDGVEVLEGWLAFYRGFHAMLTKQAAEWRAVSRKVLRATPVKGEIDWAELSREHIARYPKIRARLAE